MAANPVCKIVAVSAVAALMAMSASALANTVNLGLLTPDADGNSAYGAGNSGSSSFSETIKFGLSAPANLTVELLPSDFSNQTITSININSYSLNGAGATGSFGDSVSFAGLAAGKNYNLDLGGVLGSSGGNGQGGFKFVITATAVTPVPEPGEWGMMLAGLGLIGAVVGRRRAAA